MLDRFTFRFELDGKETRCMIYENYKDSKRPFYRLSGWGATETLALDNLRERINAPQSGIIPDYVKAMTEGIDHFKETTTLEV